MSLEPNTNQDVILDHELYGLFQRRRPDAEAFRETVEKRIDDRREEEGTAPEGLEGETLMRRVAAVLPVDPASGGTAGSAVLKVLYGGLALPALVFASVLGAFFVSVRSLRSERRRVSEPQVDGARGKGLLGSVLYRDRFPNTTNPDLILGRRLSGLVICGQLVPVFLALVGGRQIAMDVLAIVLLVAMACVVVTIRGMAQEGVFSRQEVARFSFALLILVFCGCFLWFSTILGVADGQATLGVGWAAGVVLVGTVVCVYSGWGARKASMVALGVVVLSLLYNPLALTKSSPSAIHRQLAGMELNFEEILEWEGAAALFTALKAVGAETPNLAETRARIEDAIESKRDVHPIVWTAAARMRLVDDEHWALLAQNELEKGLLDDLVQPDGRVNTTSYYEYLFPMLVATRALSQEDLGNLVANLNAAWPDGTRHDPLSDALLLIRAFECIGSEELVASRHDVLRELLRSQWVVPGTEDSYAEPGGFSPNLEQFRSSFSDTTWSAVEIMARTGVPEGIDPRWIRGYLVTEAKAHPLIFDPLGSHKGEARAALLRIEQEFGMPERSWFASLIADRLLVATLLLVVLCVLATRLAPIHTELEEVGAQP